MKISAFTNLPINSFEVYNEAAGSWELKDKSLTCFWKTSSVFTTLPNGMNIGRVDHFTKKSIDSIVKACVKQVVKREGKTGEHIITIEMYQDWDHNANREKKRENKVITIKVVA
jgi:hypothetical protein